MQFAIFTHNFCQYQCRWLSAPGTCPCLCEGSWWRSPAWPWASGTLTPCNSSVWTVRSCVSAGSYWNRQEIERVIKQMMYMAIRACQLHVDPCVCVFWMSYRAAFCPCCSLCQSSFRERMVCHACPQVLLSGLYGRTCLGSDSLAKEERQTKSREVYCYVNNHRWLSQKVW